MASILSSGAGSATSSTELGREYMGYSHRSGSRMRIDESGFHFFSPKDQHQIFRKTFITIKDSMNTFFKSVNERYTGLKITLKGQAQNINNKDRQGKPILTPFYKWKDKHESVAASKAQSDCPGGSRPNTGNENTKPATKSNPTNPAIEKLRENASNGITKNESSIPVDQVIGGIIKCLAGIIGFITGLISDVVTLVLNLISSLVNALLEELTNVLDELVGYIDNTVAAIQSVVNSLTLGITELIEKGISSLNVAGGGESAVNSLLASQYGCFLSVLPNIGAFFAQMAKALANALFNGIKNLLASAIALVGSALLSIINGLVGSITGALTAIADALDGVSDELKSCMEELSPSSYSLHDC